MNGTTTFPFQAKLYQTKKAKIFRKCKCKSNLNICNSVLLMSSQFSVATPNETTGKETEFSLVAV